LFSRSGSVVTVSADCTLLKDKWKPQHANVHEVMRSSASGDNITLTKTQKKNLKMCFIRLPVYKNENII
jgi:hypothetical protein